ncbi:MAG: MoxR-like ATPase [Phycisphaerales bacterium]|jgi:MoxR-like ATPase
MQELIERLRQNIKRAHLGGDDSVDRLICCLLARGHVLIEDVPGVGKTVLASALARSIELEFRRIQLTPDMLPADVLGVSVFNRELGRFEFHKGPVFTNLLLADEINRTTPRTQSALLEAMSESSVSVDGHVHQLGPPFMVIATQNPYEFEGTYLLPENQLDRFLMRLTLGYPDEEEERRLLDLRPLETVLQGLTPVMGAAELLSLQAAVDKVQLSEPVRGYIVGLARATREHDSIDVGLSPRGSLALAQASRAAAFMAGRDYVIPEDVLDNLVAVAAHRLITSEFGAGGGWQAAAALLEEIASGIEAPL